MSHNSASANSIVKNKTDQGTIVLLLLVNLLALSFLSSPGTPDVTEFRRWISEMSAYGLSAGFAHSDADYPPVAFLILAAAAQVGHAFGLTELFSLKCSLLFFLLATTVVFYWYTRKVALTALLQFAVILSSIALGYLDIYFAPFLLAALFELRMGNQGRAVLLFTISCFTKWQPLIIAPFICLYLLDVSHFERASFKRLGPRIWRLAAPALAIMVPLGIAFGLPILESLRAAMTFDQMLSGNALNLNWLYTFFLHLLAPDRFGPLKDGQVDLIIIYGHNALVTWPPKILFLAIYGFLCVRFFRREKTFERLLIYSLLGYLSYFLFNIGVHENHLFLLICLGWVLVSVNSKYLLWAANFSLAANANLLLFYGVFGQPLPFRRVIAGVDITLLFACANLCLFAGLLWRTLLAGAPGACFREANQIRTEAE